MPTANAMARLASGRSSICCSTRAQPLAATGLDVVGELVEAFLQCLDLAIRAVLGSPLDRLDDTCEVLSQRVEIGPDGLHVLAQILLRHAELPLRCRWRHHRCPKPGAVQLPQSMYGMLGPTSSGTVPVQTIDRAG